MTVRQPSHARQRDAAVDVSPPARDTCISKIELTNTAEPRHEAVDDNRLSSSTNQRTEREVWAEEDI